jgi:hypothetical protein
LRKQEKIRRFMGKAAIACVLAWAAVPQLPGAASAGEGVPGQGLFIGYQAYFDRDVSWTATVGTKFELVRYDDFAFAFNGRIETVSEKVVNLKGGAGLTDINYRLEPRIYWKDAVYLSLNHWSYHRADTAGDVPNLNLVTLGAEKEWECLKVNGGANYKLSNSDADYSKAVFLNLEEPLFRRPKYAVYAKQTVEAFPSVVAKAEVGARVKTPPRMFLKTVDVFAGGHFGRRKYVSSQEGIVPSGPYVGFNFNF